MLINVWWAWVSTALRSEIRCLGRLCVRPPELTNYFVWLDSSCVDGFLFRERKINVYLWVIPVTDEQLRAGYRGKHLPLMSLQTWFRSKAKSFSGGTTCSMRHMQSHNRKLHYDDCSAFCQAPLPVKKCWEHEVAVGYWFFLVVCRNKHFNRSIAESDFYPLWPSVTQAKKKLWKR